MTGMLAGRWEGAKRMQSMRPWVAVAGLFAGSAWAQNAATLGALDAYGNLETAGAVLLVSGDANANATVALAYRLVGEPVFRPAQPLVRVDATHFVGSLFGLSAGSAHELQVTLSDPDGVVGATTASAGFSTRADVLVEPTLRTLYVAPTGMNSNDGLTPATAVQTIQRGADLAQAGDIVRVAAGIYREAVSVPRSGTAAQPIVFRGDPGAILDGADAVTLSANDWQSLGSGVWRRTTGFATAHVASELGRLFQYGSLLELQGLAAGAPGGFWFDGSQLHLKFSDGLAPSQHQVHAARHPHGFYLDGRAHVRIEGFEIRHYGADEFGKGIYLRFSDDVIVRSNQVHAIGAAGVWIKGGARHRIEDNTFSDTSIFDWPWDLTKGSSAENNAIVLTDNPGRGHIVRRNQISGHFNGIGPCGSSPPPSGFTSEVDVYRNSFARHTDDGLEPEGWCANVRIFENRIRDVHMAFAVAPAAPGPTWIVRNIVHDHGNTRTSQLDGYVASAIKINSGFSTPIGPLLFLHNTIHTTAPATNAITLLAGGNATWLRTRNNLIVGSRYVLEKTHTIALDLDYDLLHTSDPTRFVRWQGASYANLVALQGNQNQEIHGLQAAPQFVSVAGGDFHLVAASPGIDAGLVLANINDGYAGSAPDLGAFEFTPPPAVLFADGFE
jgi:hypothetical protein